LRSGASNDGNDIPLDIPMFTACDLLEPRDAVLEVSKANMGLQDRETKVNLCLAKHANTPFQIMIIEFFIEMM
jgi:hypothetical protein